jgi:hypothetical protein
MTPRPGRPTPPMGREFVKRKGRGEAPGRCGNPGTPGDSQTTIQLPPLSPSAPVRRSVNRCPDGRRLAATCGVQVEDRGPWHAGERRNPQVGYPQENVFRCG